MRRFIGDMSRTEAILAGMDLGTSAVTLPDAG